MMKMTKVAAVAALALAAAACGQSGSQNVMSPEANALDPVTVNSALGSDTMNADQNMMTANDMNGVNMMDMNSSADSNSMNNLSGQ